MTDHSYNTKPMPPETATLDYPAEFTEAEYKKIARGLIPQQMEDKWLILLDGGTLNLHRGWTGFCIFQVELEKAGDKYAVRAARVNRNPEQYRGTDAAYDTRILHYLISSLLLGNEVELPEPTHLPEDVPKWAYQRGVARPAPAEAHMRAAQAEPKKWPWWKWWK